MNKRSVDSSLQIKARRYLEYVNRQEKLAYQKGESILSSLSFSLRDEILKNIYGKTFKNDISFLGENFSEVFIESLMLRAREVSYAPEELIYRKNENDDLSLFFITKGKVEIYLDFRQKFLQMTHLGQGRSFGEKEFILGDARNFSARSLECTRLIYVKRKEFLDVLESFPEDQERFLMLKDRLLHNVGVSVNEVCYFCDNKTHNLAKCPLISYQPEKNLVVDKFLNNFEQKRARFKRRKFFKFCSLKIKNEISHYAENFYEGRKGDRELYEAQVGILEEELEERKINEEIHESKIFNSRSIQIDKGKNFKNYFPSDNLDRFISNLTSRNQILPKINRQKNKSTNPKRGFNKNIQVESEIRRTSSYQKASQMIGKGYLWIKNKLLKH